MNTETTTTVVEKKKLGRRLTVVDWPTGNFTVAQLASTTPLSKVTIHQKVKDALASGVLKKAGEEKSKRGRPKAIYSLSVKV